MAIASRVRILLVIEFLAQGKGETETRPPPFFEPRICLLLGLVFESWVRHALIDLNSLHPSIIEDCNVDFTMVSPIEDEDLAARLLSVRGFHCTGIVGRRRVCFRTTFRFVSQGRQGSRYI